MKNRVTQTDVARVAGVHNTTVSLALRNSPAIPEPTRKRIQEIAERLGYQPDPALRALVAYRNGRMAQRRKDTLAYVTNWDSRWGWRAIPAQEQAYRGAQRKAAEFGYQVEHFWLGEPDLSPRRLSGMLFHRGVTGLLLASHLPAAGGLEDFEWSRLCAVKIGTRPLAPALHRVTNDHAGIVRLAMRSVLAGGYRRIGFVLPKWCDALVDHAWSAGFLVEQNRLAPGTSIPILSVSGTRQPADALATGHDDHADVVVLEHWYRKHRPEVIIGFAPPILTLIERIGLVVPRDVGYVDLNAERGDPRLAGICQHGERVGEIAVEALVGQLQQNLFGLPEVPTTTLVDGSWVPGRSLPPLRLPGAWDEEPACCPPFLENAVPAPA